MYHKKSAKSGRWGSIEIIKFFQDDQVLKQANTHTKEGTNNNPDGGRFTLVCRKLFMVNGDKTVVPKKGSDAR